MKKFKEKLGMLIIALALPALVFAQEGEEQPEPPWHFSIGSRYLSRYVSYGVDLGNERSAATLGATAEHNSGFSFGADVVKLLGEEGGIDRWSFNGAYELAISERFSISAEYTHYQYQSDSLNILASLSNSLSLAADFDFDVVSSSLSYDTYLGARGASYVSFDVSTFHQINKLSILPVLQLTLMSQEVEDRFLKNPNKGQRQGMGQSSMMSTSTLTGLSSINASVVLVYALGNGFTATLVPSLIHSPKAELSSRTTQFVWSAGLRYSF